jgi:hypothetical protein
MRIKSYSTLPLGAEDEHSFCNFIFHSGTVHLNIIKVFIYQLMHKRIVLKGILKFTLK